MAGGPSVSADLRYDTRKASPMGIRVLVEPWEGKKAGAQVGSASALKSDM